MVRYFHADRKLSRNLLLVGAYTASIDALTVAGDRELLESLMFDAEATRGAVSGWRKENFEDTPNGGPFRK